MSTLEERIQALEQENATRKREYELLTIAVNALVSKEVFEKIQEQNSRLFDVLNNHNMFTNERLGDLQNQLVELDGKIVGLRTETRQHFTELNRKIAGLQTELDRKIVGLQTETRHHFTELDGKIVGLQTETGQRFTEQTTLLEQILARLPEKP